MFRTGRVCSPGISRVKQKIPRIAVEKDYGSCFIKTGAMQEKGTPKSQLQGLFSKIWGEQVC